MSKTKYSTINEPVCLGLSASPGVAIGEIALDSEKAKEEFSSGKPVILVRDDISTTDIVGMAVCQGTITRTGGRTSHAAVVARQMNKVCIVGCQALMINMGTRKCNFGNKVLKEGDYVSLDGNTGNIYVGKVEFKTETPEKLISEVQRWKTMKN